MGCCCVCVKESSVGILERFGKFDQVVYPGCQCICPCTQSMVGTLSMRVEQHKINVEIRSKDNVFINVHLAVLVKIAQKHSDFIQYKYSDDSKINEGSSKFSILSDSECTLESPVRSIDPNQPLDGLLYNAFYRLDHPISQILVQVEEYFRFHGMEYTLDDMFAAKNDMTKDLQKILNIKMNPYGYVVNNILVLDLVPDVKVRTAMNEIIACEKEKIAQQSRAEAEKITRVLAAEAEARTRELEGEGIANARKAILNGLQTSVDHFAEAIPGVDPNMLLKTVLMTQYMDVMKDTSMTGHNTFILPSSPAQILSIENQIRASIM